jgi:hypothetical protein
MALMDRSLREQELRLRAVLAIFSRAEQRVARLGGNVGWIGPASDAYGLGVHALRAELRVTGDHLAASLAGTVNALSASERGATSAPGCG